MSAHKIKEILETPHDDGFVAFKARDGRLHPVTAVTPFGFKTPGFHFLGFSRIKPTDFEIVHREMPFLP
jgi:hypothetical protein